MTSLQMGLQELPPQTGPEQANFGAIALGLEWLEWPDQVTAKPSASSTATPAEFGLGSLRDGRLRVVEPILVSWTMENAEVVLKAQEISEFGFGADVSKAIADLQTAIAELYFKLDAEQDRLGPDLAAVRETLTRKIRRAEVIREGPEITLAEMLDQITPENLHSEQDTGPPVGNEEW